MKTVAKASEPLIKEITGNYQLYLRVKHSMKWALVKFGCYDNELIEGSALSE